jgi:hypothetical protein
MVLGGEPFPFLDGVFVEALKAWPQIEPVWLPTSAPWLNPIEKRWRWLGQDVLKLHRLADDWKATVRWLG